MFRTRWINETGGEWFGSTYTYIEDAQIGAKCYFEDNDPDDVSDDIVQIWEVDEDGDTVGDAIEEYTIADFKDVRHYEYEMPLSATYGMYDTISGSWVGQWWDTYEGAEAWIEAEEADERDWTEGERMVIRSITNEAEYVF